MNRRDFLKENLDAGLALAGAGLAISSCSSAASVHRGALLAAPTEPLVVASIERVRVGVIGVGRRGMFLFRDYLRLDGTDLIAVCDVDLERTAQAQQIARESGAAAPRAYSSGEEGYLEMLGTEQLDLVIIATPWEWHTPMCVAAMKAGAHAAVEVPAAVTVEECWDLVYTAEQTRRHCIMLENVNYFQPQLAVLEMVRSGVFGDILHVEGAYFDDIRSYLLSTDRHNPPYWRLEHIRRRNACLYPTHGLGPAAMYTSINRGNRFTTLYSTATGSQAIEQYIMEYAPNSPYAGKEFACGGVVTTLMETENGQTITLKYCTAAPTAYELGPDLKGTRGGVVPAMHRYFVNLDTFSDGKARNLAHFTNGMEPQQYNHPFWGRWSQVSGSFETPGGRHGNGDTIMNHRVIECLRLGLPMDMDVYDAAALSAVVGLSETSISKGQPVEVPDFTRGRWKTRTDTGYQTA
jgi:predicted dehydrogenase